ncbi:hypothetical protein [Halolamina rubra]|uniref:hypothetical protein n=1 Tax=Halolamina rubra TaxID=1380430 RepID=UPI0006788DF3|nr:hypothetical protein [Halolamina rubra]
MTFYRESEASASGLDPEAVHFLAAQESEQRQREKFVEQIAAHADERQPRVSDWEDALTYLAEKLQEERLIVAIDEFPSLIREGTPALEAGWGIASLDYAFRRSRSRRAYW